MNKKVSEYLEKVTQGLQQTAISAAETKWKNLVEEKLEVIGSAVKIIT